ncbi:hypothetical protein ACQVP2_29380 [Methylobacterium aquaticum]|uniref:hypothetical protein n=1 Tax=Methylobacterium aquaticum TaxID=270351 RepID=UPI003D17EC1D
MAGFDPAEYEAFLSRSSTPAPARARNPAVPAPNPFEDPASASPVPASATAPASAAGGFDPREYEAFLSRGAPTEAPAASFDARFRGDGSAPARTARTVDTGASALGRGLQERADEMLVGPASAGNAASAALSEFANTAALNVPRNLAAGLATLTNGASFESNYRLARDRDAALARQNPKSALAGEVAGIVGGAAALPALSGASTLAGRAGQAAVTGAGYGAAGEFLDTKDVGRAAVAGGVGGVAGGTLAGAIEKLGPGMLRMIQRGTPYRGADGALSAEAEAALRGAGLDPAALPEGLDARLADAFKTKGPSPAVAREAQAAEFGIPLSRGQATQDPAAIGLERRALAGVSGGGARDVGTEFMGRQLGAVDEARAGVLRRIAGDAPAIDNPRAAAERIADRARGLANDVDFRAAAAQHSADMAVGNVRGTLPPDPLDAAGAAMQGVRDAAGRSKAAYRAAYDDVAAIPGEFAPGALDRMGTRVQRGLGPEYPVDPVLTPAAHRALADLDNLPGLFGAEPGTGPNLQQLDQVRKRLVAYRSGTGANATDRRAMGKILEEFDGHTQAALESGLFGPRQAAPRGGGMADDLPGAGGTLTPDTPALPGEATAPFEAMSRARGLFADHQRTFKPNGPGDDVGRAVQRIVERDAQPGEVATMLFGGSQAGNTGLSVRMAERMRGVLGEDSPGWQAVQQGLISKAIEGRGGDVGARLDHLLTGEGRTLAARVLNPEQRAGLEVYRKGLAQAEAARTSLPEWVEDLARTGFDPNRVTAGLFGSGVPGARVGSAEYARTLQQAFGKDSPEWSNLRQAAFLQLVGHDPATRLPAAKEAERIRAFLGGEGKGLAETLFNPSERALMRSYAGAVAATHMPNGGRLPDGGRASRIAQQAMNLIAGAVGFKLGGPGGGALGAMGARALKDVAAGGLNTARAARAFEGGAPRAQRPAPTPPPSLAGGIGTASGLYSGPSRP